MEAQDLGRVLYEKDGAIARIVLNWPEKANSQSSEMVWQVTQALDLAEHDYDVKVVIIKGNGKGFCAGHMISGGMDAPKPEDFDAFLATLNHAKRKKIKQERRRVHEAGIRFEWFAGRDVTDELWTLFNRCYRETYRQHHSTPYLNLEFFRAIGHSMLEINAIEKTEDNWRRLREEYLGQLPAFLPRCRGHVLPGIEKLLDRLSQVEEVVLGLLTGNLREGARLKLEHYRLNSHFSFGGFGDDHMDRNHVAEMAVAAAQQHAPHEFDPARVWVIGDTPLDVRCARWIKARVLAVATGTHSRAELVGCEPDLLADDLSDTEQIAAWLT